MHGLSAEEVLMYEEEGEGMGSPCGGGSLGEWWSREPSYWGIQDPGDEVDEGWLWGRDVVVEGLCFILTIVLKLYFCAYARSVQKDVN